MSTSDPPNDRPTDVERGPSQFNEAEPNHSSAHTIAAAESSSESPTLAPNTTHLSGDGRNHKSVSGYVIESELGRGGMGVVYKARQISLNRYTALKMLLNADHTTPDLLARFQEEAQAIAALQHPNIVQVYEVGVHDCVPFFSLELVDGGSLAESLSNKLMSVTEAASLIQVLARAVNTVHQKGIIHRDLKPANILLASDGTPKITDFGLAKSVTDDRGRTVTGAILGTPSYMAPEQAGGRRRDVGPPADIYGLGAILYETLTGRPPFSADSPLDTLLLVVSEPVKPPRELQQNVPRSLEAICLKCLQKEPSLRYGTAGELADDLERFLDGKPTKARPMSLGEHSVRWVAQHPGTFLLLALTGILAIGSVVLVCVIPTSGLALGMLSFSASVIAFLLPGRRGMLAATAISLAMGTVIWIERKSIWDQFMVALVPWAITVIGSTAARCIAYGLGVRSIVTVLSGFWLGALTYFISGFVLGAVLPGSVSFPVSSDLIFILSGAIAVFVFIAGSLTASLVTSRRNRVRSFREV